VKLFSQCEYTPVEPEELHQKHVHRGVFGRLPAADDFGNRQTRMFIENLMIKIRVLGKG